MFNKYTKTWNENEEITIYEEIKKRLYRYSLKIYDIIHENVRD